MFSAVGMIENVRNVSQKINRFLADVGPQISVTGQQFIAGLNVLGILLSLLFQKNLLIPALVFEFVSLVMYLFTGQATDESAPKAQLWSKVNLYLAVVLIMLAPYCMLTHLVGNSSAMMAIGLSFVVVGVAGATAFQMSDTGKKAWESLAAAGSRLGVSAATEYKSGDVVLCNDKEKVEAKEKDPREILPYKDRFLHMLILGPTGGGKTSQVILPMVDQDIKNLEAGVTVIEPKGDLAREVAMMAKAVGRPYIYFDPSVDNCPFFNPLVGDEDDVIENAVTTFLMLNPDSPQYFKDLSEQLVRYTLKVLKRLDREEGIDGKYATFVNMNTILQNPNQDGRKLVQQFAKTQKGSDAERKENADIASWFINEYYAERSKVYENSSGIRAQVSKIIANRYLREVLNPDVTKNEHNEIDFDKHLAEGGVICICTAQGKMRDLGKFLGYFIILQLQSAVFRRPGNEDTRRAHFLYIDEFQTYSTPGFSDMLTQGRSYRVASHLATQARAQIAMGGGRDGKNFVELVSTNARNLVIFPGISVIDAEYYSKQFGEYEKVEVMKGISRKKFNFITGGLDKLGHPTEMIREQAKMTANFTPTDIMYRPFGELTYCIIKNNTLQKPKVGIVKWLDKEYDHMLKEMIETEIVPHEYRHLQETPKSQMEPEFEFVDDDTDVKESASSNTPIISKSATPAYRPATPAYNSATDLGLGEEPIEDAFADAAMAPPPGSDIPKDVLFEDPKRQQDDDDLFAMSGSGDKQDSFYDKFDDMNRDPLIDDDDLI